MKYARQAQEHLDRLDQSIAQLRDLIKRGEIDAALHYMEEGLLKERFEELQNTITMSSTNTLGASGTTQTGAL